MSYSRANFVGSVIGLIYGLVGWSLYRWIFGEKNNFLIF